MGLPMAHQLRRYPEVSRARQPTSIGRLGGHGSPSWSSSAARAPISDPITRYGAITHQPATALDRHTYRSASLRLGGAIRRDGSGLSPCQASSVRLRFSMNSPFRRRTIIFIIGLINVVGLEMCFECIEEQIDALYVVGVAAL
jgi:hypothetical protein